YWCHVMERQSFANKEVAKLLNKYFVCIKVDSEERPDIDEIYMRAVQVMKQRTGWPLSLFLTTEGKPIFGFTYLPPDDKEIEGHPVRGFKSVLKLVDKLHREKGKELAEQADYFAELTARSLSRSALGMAVVDLDRTLVAEAVAGIEE